MPTDVSQQASVDALAQAALDAYSGVHVVCNNAGSALSFQGGPDLVAYGSTKFAVGRVTEALHLQLRERDTPVRAHLLCPGGVATRSYLAERNRPPDLRNPEPLPTPSRCSLGRGNRRAHAWESKCRPPRSRGRSCRGCVTSASTSSRTRTASPARSAPAWSGSSRAKIRYRRAMTAEDRLDILEQGGRYPYAADERAAAGLVALFTADGWRIARRAIHIDRAPGDAPHG